ncbi:hypothetical protein Hanom_Chr02g00104871 [Helianthus anomalus]
MGLVSFENIYKLPLWLRWSCVMAFVSLSRFERLVMVSLLSSENIFGSEIANSCDFK